MALIGWLAILSAHDYWLKQQCDHHLTHFPAMVRTKVGRQRNLEAVNKKNTLVADLTLGHGAEPVTRATYDTLALIM